MIAAVVALAIVAAGLGVTVAALGVRLAGARDELGAARRRADAAAVAGADWKAAAERAGGELLQLQARHKRLEAHRQTEIEELEAIAARCSDPAEIRRQLQKLTAPRSQG